MSHPLATLASPLTEGWIECNIVIAGEYAHTNGEQVFVICGPNEHESTPGEIQIHANGDVEVHRGFAYMHIATGTNPSPQNARPNVKTPRVSSIGVGSTWMVQVQTGMTKDRVFFIDGTEANAVNRADSAKNRKLQDPNKKTFTEFKTDGTFTPEQPYANDNDAATHAAYVNQYVSKKGWQML